ncbi:MAG: acyl--CoA ligase [Gammaproteobacteria bacterium]|nr:acyl--CoA ligase [Gammaproteobacteria bacterium]
MILGEPSGIPSGAGVGGGVGGRATLDDLFRRAAARHPDALALVDPPDRERFTDSPARSLTYAQADRVISAIAGRLHRIGLRPDAVVGLQLANSVEFVLTFLAVMRAGMIAMPLPLLWRRADLTAALGRAGAHALIVSGRVGSHKPVVDALQCAAATFHIRFVCGFGPDLPDGVVALDELFTAEMFEPLPELPERPYPPGPAAHLAVVTWDMCADGAVAVARSHAELAAGGLAVLLESRLRQDAVILTSMMMSSFPGLAGALMPWLLVGGTLHMHHPFAPGAFVAQQRSAALDAVVVPGPLVATLAQSGTLMAGTGLSSVIAIWSAPERMARAPAWRDTTTDLVDVQVFGEVGLIAARRGSGGRPGPVSFGPIALPRGSRGGVIVGEVRATANGTIALRGPMVPNNPFPPGIERTTLPHFKVPPGGFVDTGFACWSDQGNTPLLVTAPPRGTVSVGGCRFRMRDLQDMVADVDRSARIAALPDAIIGYRLAGTAAHPDIPQVLSERGLNPLLANAFLSRHGLSQDRDRARSA